MDKQFEILVSGCERSRAGKDCTQICTSIGDTAFLQRSI